MDARVICGDALAVLREQESESVDCVVTSPPYWRMRDYGHEGQLGMEEILDEYIARLATIFDEVRRMLRPEGTCWINLGDCYARKGGGKAKGSDMGRRYLGTPARSVEGVAQGEIIGIPWMLALEMRRRGWMVRGEQFWSKANPAPEGGNCFRPHRSHEHVFLFTKQARHYYDKDAVRTPLTPATLRTIGVVYRKRDGDPWSKAQRWHQTFEDRVRSPSRDTEGNFLGANLRSIWHLPSEKTEVEHFATMPKRLAQICICAGCPPGGIVLDPFTGSGTTGLVAIRSGRGFLGVDLVPAYVQMATDLIRSDTPLFPEEVGGDAPEQATLFPEDA